MIYPTLCIYHGNCQDGFGAAYAVWKQFGETATEYYPGVHGEAPPDCTGENVVLVDFSYKLSVLEKIIAQAKSVTIIDHHKTAQADIEPLIQSGKIRGIFDLSKSGAKLAWEYYHPFVPCPDLIEYISDRDLWQFKLPHAREISAALFSYPYDFNVLDTIVENFQTNITYRTAFLIQGEAIERKHHKDVAELVAVGKRKMKISGYNVGVCNLPYTMASDAAALLAKENIFGATYYDKPGLRIFSLRSIGDFDVSQIAKMYGGGGHKNAAGFGVCLNWEGDTDE